jgi:probable rRNA maturation factor
MAPRIQVEVNNQQTAMSADTARLTRLVRAVLRSEGIRSANVSLALVDDATIRRLNRQYLNHDYATDVLSFPLTDRRGHLEAEIVISGQTAARRAGRYGWTAADELLLYAVHGCLHLSGYDDVTAPQREQMRQLELEYLGRFGLKPRYEPNERGKKEQGK